MNSYSIGELADITDGHLNLGSMPPVGGAWEPVGRLVLNIADVRPGDVFWSISEDDTADPEEAFARGAQGVVAAGRDIEPWAGAFSLRVDDAEEALERLAAWSRAAFRGVVIGFAGARAALSADAVNVALGSDYAGMVSSTFAAPAADRCLELAQVNAELDYALLPIDEQDFFSAAPISILCRPNIAVINCTRDTRQLKTSAVEAERMPLRREWPLDQVHPTAEAYPDCSSRRVLSSASPNQPGWIVWHGNEALQRAAGRWNTRMMSVGERNGCDVTAHNVGVRGNRLWFTIDGQVFSVRGTGREHLVAALVAVAVSKLMNVSRDDFVRRLSNWPATRTEETRVNEVA